MIAALFGLALALALLFGVLVRTTVKTERSLRRLRVEARAWPLERRRRSDERDDGVR